jgi:hypothetical protein
MTSTACSPSEGPPSDDAHFLKDLVKASRQRTQHVRWTDRDGTERLTALTPVEARRLHAIARTRAISPEVVLQQAAHIPARIGSRET